MRRVCLWALAFWAGGALALGGWAADRPDVKACQDTCAIRWHLPGHFEEARKAAEKGNRILMIKGIAFGIDAEGAACATKGTW